MRRHANLYTLAEGARLLGVPASTLSRWARGWRVGDRSAQPLISSDGELSFQDFAELSVIASLKHLGYSLRRIRHAATVITQKRKVDRPFLEGVLVDDLAKEIFWREYDAEEDGRVWSASSDGQAIITEAVRTKVIPPRVDIDPETGEATQVRPYSRPNHPLTDPALVKLNPAVRWGRPITVSFIDIEAIAVRFTWGESLDELTEDMRPGGGRLELEEGLRYHLLTLTPGERGRLAPTPTIEKFEDGLSVAQLAENSTERQVQEEIREGLDRVLAA